jgi:CheY-like chemotaxis protein
VLAFDVQACSSCRLLLLPGAPDASGVRETVRVDVPRILLVDRYAGVRTALAQRLAATARVAAEAGSLGEVRRCLRQPLDAVVAGVALADGDVRQLAEVVRSGPAPHRPLIVYTWLPPDERPAEVAAADRVVGLPLVPGLLAALRALALD